MDARAITRALQGTWHGGYGTARCPAHEDRSPSLSLRDGADGRLLLRCFAGCPFEAVRDALVNQGLLPARQPRKSTRRDGPRLPRRAAHPTAPTMPEAASVLRARGSTDAYPSTDAARAEDGAKNAARTARALALWSACRPVAGSLVETYLAARGLALPPGDALRFHPSLKHPSGGCWPAMVALVTRGLDGAPLAIHRTYLARDGSGKAPVSPAKMMLGPTAGGVVRLGEATERVFVGEGIETCLSVMRALGGSEGQTLGRAGPPSLEGASAPVWAALSTSGLASLLLPPSVRDVTLLADGDEPGERAAREAAARWMREGRRVRIARPLLGSDFNDLLRGAAGPGEDDGTGRTVAPAEEVRP